MGEDKSIVVKKGIKEEINENITISILQKHNNVNWYIDEEASILLKKEDFQIEIKKKEEIRNLKEILKKRIDENLLPKNKKILIVSPHPGKFN
jgi:hypothetical protein